MSIEEISREIRDASIDNTVEVETHTETITFAELTSGGYEEGHCVEDQITPTADECYHGDLDITPTNDEVIFSGGQGELQTIL